MNTKQNICIVNEGNIYFQTHTSIKVNGGNIWSQRIYTKQTKDLVPIVFLHGGPGGEHVKWKWAMKDLCVQFPLIFYDQIGGGFSKQLDKHINRENLWTIQNFVLQLDTLIKYYNLTDFILAGTSWGSTLALQYYLHKPKTQPLGLILNSPLISTKIWVEDAQKLKKQLPKALYEALQECEQKNDTKSQKYYEIQSYYYKTHIMRSEMLTNQHQKVLKATQGMFNAEAYIYMWGRNQFFPTGTLVGYDRVPHLGDVGVPVLFTCGEFDEATPDSVYGFHQKIPGSEYFMFEGCSHCPYFEDPKKYQLILSQFYRKVVKK